MKKLTKTKPSSRRDFLKKSALGVASAGFLDNTLLQDSTKTVQRGSNRVPIPPELLQRFTKELQETLARPGMIKIEADDNSCRIRPGKFYTEGNEYIAIQAPKESKVTILFPEPAITGDRLIELDPDEFRIVRLRIHDTRERTMDRKKLTHYPYAVFSHRARHFGEGNSEPELIVP